MDIFYIMFDCVVVGIIASEASENLPQKYQKLSPKLCMDPSDPPLCKVAYMVQYGNFENPRGGTCPSAP